MPTVNLAITDTADDGYEVVASAFVTDDVVACGFNSVAFVGFLRFLSVDVAQGATIGSATLTMNVLSVVGTPNTTWFGVDDDDAAQFADPGNLPSNATTTTASVDGNPPGTGSQEFDVTTIVQEIVNRAGWASGNAMAFVCKDNAGTGANSWVGEDLDAAGTAEAQLDITYTEASTGVPSTYRRQANARLGMRRFGW